MSLKAGTSIATALDLGVLNTNIQTLDDAISTASTLGYYKFMIAENSKLNIKLSGLSQDVNLFLLNADGSQITQSATSGNADENIFQNLRAGSYYFYVSGGGTGTNYKIETSAIDSLFFKQELENQSLDLTFPTEIDQPLLTLNLAEDIAKTKLWGFAQSQDFEDKIALAFGQGHSVGELRSTWLTSKIYLAQELINMNSKALISAVLLEEYGHSVDAQLNTVNSVGDEREIFSTLVRGKTLEADILRDLTSEGDNGQSIQVEQQHFEYRVENDTIPIALGKTIVFIDSAVTDPQTLRNGLIPDTEAVIITSHQDGIEQITAFLQQHPNTTTIHIISHGAPGCLYLGSGQLNLTNFDTYQQQLQHWSSLNILLYGCEVAAGDAGAEFINKLHQITQASISASTTKTGNAVLGGNWQLEVSVPDFQDTSLALDEKTLATYSGILEPTIAWTRLLELNTNGYDQAYALTTGRDGAIYEAGSTDFGNSAIAFIAKYNPDGTAIWTKQDSNRSIAYALTIDSDGAIYMAGDSFNDAFITKYDPDGNVVWRRLLTSFSSNGVSSTFVIAKALITGLDGSIYMAGFVYGNLDGQINAGDNGSDAFITKYNPDGTKVWTRLLGTSGNDDANALTTGLDGAIYMAGNVYGNLDGQINAGDSDVSGAFITKYNPDGTKIWTRLLGTSGSSTNALTTGLDGAIYMVGYAEGNLDGQISISQRDAFITKYNPDGTKIWTRLLDINGDDDYFYSIRIGSDGFIYASGETVSPGGIFHGFIAKYNPDGAKVWTKVLGSSGLSNAPALTFGIDDALYVGGSINPTGQSSDLAGNFDVFLTKLIDVPTIDIPTVSVSDAYVSVNENQNTVIKFRITLSNPSDQDVTIVYSTSDESENSTGQGAAIDYQSIINGTLTFSPGETTKEIAVTVFGEKGVSDQDLEIFAKDTAYRNWEEGQDVDQVPNANSSPYDDLGYYVDQVFNDPTSDFQAVGLTSNEIFSLKLTSANNATIVDGDATGTIYDLGKAPILATRGTASPQDIFSDANPLGVGFDQYSANKNAVETWLKKVSQPENGEVIFRPNLTGHSLGGALTQLIAYNYTGNLGKVVTFNSPGITSSGALKAGITSTTHYITSSDIVSMAGYNYLPGSYVLSDYSSFDPQNSPPGLFGVAGTHLLPMLSFQVGYDQTNLDNWQNKPTPLSQIPNLSSSDLSNFFFTYLPDPDYFAFQVAVSLGETLLPPELRPNPISFAQALTFRGTTEKSRIALGTFLYGGKLLADTIVTISKATSNAASKFSSDKWNQIIQRTKNSLNQPTNNTQLQATSRSVNAFALSISDVSSDIPINVSSDVPINVSSDIPINLSSDIPINLSSDIPINVSSDIPINVSSDIPINVSSDIPSDVSSDVLINVSSDIPSDVSPWDAFSKWTVGIWEASPDWDIQTFSDAIANINTPPGVENPILDQVATEDKPFSLTFAETTFVEIDPNDSLIYSATLADDSSLPTWLSFNPTTRSFLGTPTKENIDSLNIKVTATDKSGATVSDVFTLAVNITDNDAEIRGLQWNDVNGNGVKDTTETGLKDWKIYLDTNTNGQLDTDELSTTTDTDGNYSFTNLRPGTYTVAEQLQSGWKQTYPGVSVTTTSSDIQLLSPSSPLITSDTFTTTSATSLVNLDKFWADSRFKDIKGKGFSTVIIDTGADVNHPLFGADANNDGIADKIVYQYDFADNDTDASDKNNHGSHIASIASAVAPESNLIILKVFKDSGTGSFSDLEKALQWVNSNTSAYNIASVNLSLGDGQDWTTPLSRYGIGDELAAIASQNVLISAAAGNGFYTYNSQVGLAYPAIDPSVISVGAVWADNFGSRTFSNGAIDYSTAADRIASFSQRSPLLDVFAPGILITGANATGGTITMGGTSQATPYVNAIATLAQQIAQNYLGRKLTLNEFRTLLDTKSDLIIDGDNENDNVTNTGVNYSRINILSLAEGILSLNSSGTTTTPNNPTNNGTPDPLKTPDSILNLVHTVTLTSGQIAKDINFGNQKLNQLPTFKNNGDRTFQIGGDQASKNLTFQITKQNPSKFTETGLFKVDDDLGTINGIKPEDPGYLAAALDRFQIISSIIPTTNLPQGFDGKTSRSLNLNYGDIIRFGSVNEGSIDQLRQNPTFLNQLTLSEPTTLKITDTNGNLALNWQAPLNLNITATIDNTPTILGTTTQNNPQGELIDLRQTTKDVTATFSIYREAAYNNNIYFYTIQNETGTILDGTTTLKPTDSGYIQVALRDAIAEVNLSTPNQTTTTTTATLNKGLLLAPIIVINGTKNALLDNNSLNDPAAYTPFILGNSDKVDHIRLLGDNTFGFEDLAGGGDMDYNDVIVKVNLQSIG